MRLGNLNHRPLPRSARAVTVQSGYTLRPSYENRAAVLAGCAALAGTVLTLLCAVQVTG